MDLTLNLRYNLVHGIRADYNKISPRLLQAFGRLSRYFSAFLPFSRGLAFFDLLKIHAVKNASGGVETSQPFFHRLIDNPIISNRAFPTHTADQADCLHLFSSSIFWHDGQ